MTADDGFDRQLTSWLDTSAGAAAPDYLDETLAALGNLHQRPAWAIPGRWLPATNDGGGVIVGRRPTMIAVIVAVLLGTSLIALASVGGRLFRSTTPNPPAHGLAKPGLIAFDRDGEVVLANPDGSGTRLLSPSSSTQFGATFSPDGTRVAFWQEDDAAVMSGTQLPSADLWVVDADGSHAVNLTPDVTVFPKPFAPVGSWSPDGSSIVFSSENDAYLYVAPADASAPPRQIGDASQFRSYPTWAPDGSLIAFTGVSRDWNGALVAPQRPAVYVIRPDGTGQEQVSRDGDWSGTGLLPQWSPDGSSLLFGADATVPGGSGPVQPEGLVPIRLVIAEPGSGGWTERVVGEPAANWIATFSTDGSRIAMLRARPGTFEGDLFVVNVDGTGLRRVSDRLVNASLPCWSPDDRTIAVLTGPSSAGNGLFGLSDQTYVLFPIGSGQPVEIPAGTVNGVLACSWQRLAP